MTRHTDRTQDRDLFPLGDRVCELLDALRIVHLRCAVVVGALHGAYHSADLDLFAVSLERLAEESTRRQQLWDTFDKLISDELQRASTRRSS